MPLQETTYREFCFGVSTTLGLNSSDWPYHIVGFEPAIKEDTKKYLHHFTLYASSGVCTETGGNTDQKGPMKGPMIWVWVSLVECDVAAKSRALMP